MELFLAAPVPGPIEICSAPAAVLIAVILFLAVGPPVFLVLRNALSTRLRTPRARQLRFGEVKLEPKRRAA